MPHASIAIQVLPKCENSSREELIRVVDAVIAHIAASGFPYVVSPFETTVEGDFSRLMDLVRECQEVCIREGAVSVSSYVKIVYAPHEEILSIDEKISKYR